MEKNQNWRFASVLLVAACSPEASPPVDAKVNAVDIATVADAVLADGTGGATDRSPPTLDQLTPADVVPDLGSAVDAFVPMDLGSPVDASAPIDLDVVTADRATADDGDGAADAAVFDRPLDVGAPASDAARPRVLCRSDRECLSSGAVCDRVRGHCVGCREDGDCGGGQVCLGDQCAPSRACGMHRDCPGQLCHSTRAVCVDCVSTVDCLTGGTCLNGGCVQPPRPCRSTRECTELGQVCDASRGVCVECVADLDCGGALVCGDDRLCTERVCTPGSRACVSATRVRACDERGLTETQTNCAAGEGCIAGTCRLRLCAPRATSCEDATTRAVCSDDGFSRTAQACGAGERCEAGACVARACVPLSVVCASATERRVCDPVGSGSTVVPCPSVSNASPRCDAGLCGFACNVGRADCDGVSTNGCEVDVGGDVSNCGACGVACPLRAGAMPTCTGGRCGSSCLSDRGDCDGDPSNGCEAVLTRSAEHCGACGRACGAGAVCNSGACGSASWSSYFVARGGAVTSVAARDPLGITVAGGHFSNTTRFIDPIASLGFGDAWLASYDAMGNYRWVKRFGGPQYESTQALAVDASGNIFAAGVMGGPTSFDGQVLQPSDTGDDVWVGSWTRDGVNRWLRHLPGQGAGAVLGIALDASGGVWLSGEFSGSMTAGAVTLNAQGVEDAWVARLRSGDGAVLAARAFGGSRDELPANVVVDPRGGAVLSVYSESINLDLGSGPIFNPGTMLLVLRLNESLAVVTSHTALSVGRAYPRAAITPTGSYLLGMDAGPFATFDARPLGGSAADAVVISIGPTGALLWRVLIDAIDNGSGVSTDVVSLAVTPEGGVWAALQVAGSTWTAGSVRVGAGSSVLMVSPDGTPERAAVPLDSNNLQSTTTQLYALSVGVGDVILGGTFRSRMTIFNTAFSSGSSDPAGFILRAPR